MTSKTLVVPHFIGPASLSAVEHERLVTSGDPVRAIRGLNSRARSNARRVLVGAWVGEELLSRGEDTDMAFIEGWRAQPFGYFTDNHRVQEDIIPGAQFDFRLLQILNDTKVTNFPLDNIHYYPVSRCTLEEAYGISDVIEQKIPSDHVNVIAVTDQFSPSQPRLQSKLNVAFRGNDRVTSDAYSVDQALAILRIPLTSDRLAILKASRLGRVELAKEWMEEGKALGLHMVSELHRHLCHPKRGDELEVRMAHKMRKNPS